MWERIFGWLTAPRVALLVFLGVGSMFWLIMTAEIPLGSALNAVVVLHQAGQKLDWDDTCEKAKFSQYSLDRPLNSFDGRPDGYDRDEAEQILCAMQARSGAGREVYLQKHFPRDMAFAALYGPALAALWLFLLAGFGWQHSFLKYLVFVPLVGAGLDLTENLFVHSLVSGSPPGDASIIPIASLITAAKWHAVAGSAGTVLALCLVYLLWRSVWR